jgi:BirA family biotin operon repressor/biotin-[acetyl-CoA-carboxylase] ligase
MNLEHLNQMVARIDYVEATGSTNEDVAKAAVESPADWPDLSVLAAGSQTAGRGRRLALRSRSRFWFAPTESASSILVGYRFSRVWR